MKNNTDKEQIEALYEIRAEITKEIKRLEALVELDAYFLDVSPQWCEQQTDETVAI